MFAIVKCPSCGFIFIIEVESKEHLWNIRTKCRKCNKSFKVLNKKKPSWQGNLAIQKLFADIKTAQEYLKKFQNSNGLHSL